MLANGFEGYGGPGLERIHRIDDGDYQGTLVFVIGGKGYQLSTYWYVKVSYGLLHKSFAIPDQYYNKDSLLENHW